MSETSANPMVIERDRVVTFHYRLYDEAGELLESSHGGRTIVALHGHGNIVAGVERALGGHFAGDSFSTTVSPAEGYGERRDDWTQRVSKKHLVDAPRRPRVGMQVALQTEHGARPVTVIKVGSSVVDVDLNHPMAGMTLRFDIEVMSVRAAEAEEVAHGHAHGPGGHGH